MVTILVGCSGDDTVAPPPNRTPSIDFAVDSIAVPRSAVISLSAAVSDADGDALTVTWAKTRGAFNLVMQGTPRMDWTTPGTTGRDTIWATVSDGTASATSMQPFVTATRQQATQIIAPGATWTTANSPYFVRTSTSTLVVEDLATLTIEPGVELYIDQSDMEFIVEGTLAVQGTSVNPARMYPNRRMPSPGFWKGIRAETRGAPPMVDLDYVHISHAVHAVRAIASAGASLTGCRLRRCEEAAVLHNSQGALRIEDCTIMANEKSGIQIEAISPARVPQSVTIQGDSIVLNGITGENTAYLFEAGILLDFDDAAVTVIISGCDISRNGFPGIRLRKAVYPVISNNIIQINDLEKATGLRFNLRLESSPPWVGTDPFIDARNNFWNTSFPLPADSVTLKQAIYDGYDDGGIAARVWVDPWLTAMP
jgi:parallel beta-helix repeat protein